MALLEAAACGVPVVGTPVGVLPEVGRVTFCEKELTREIGRVVRDEAWRQELGGRALASATAGYNARGRNRAVHRAVPAGLYSPLAGCGYTQTCWLWTFGLCASGDTCCTCTPAGPGAILRPFSTLVLRVYLSADGVDRMPPVTIRKGAVSSRGNGPTRDQAGPVVIPC